MMTTETKNDTTPTQAFMDPSPQALNSKVKAWYTDYEHLFDQCPVGKSFKIDKLVAKLNTIRPYASRKGKEHNKKFKVIDHGTVYEIHRKE